MQQIGSKLFKMDSKGKIRVWEIFVGEEDGRNFYSVSHGQENGSLQTTKVLVDEGKNIGRANETTAKTQCVSEAEALYKKQLDRKGYTDTIPSAQPTLPMLAHKYSDYVHKINWPCAISTKIDGIRLIIEIKGGKVKCTSRTGTEILNLEHITDELLSLGKDIVLDGELYSDDIAFEEIVSIVRKTKSKDPRMPKIYFYAFDLINEKTYHERVVALDHLLIGLSNSKVVPWKIVKTEEELFAKHKQNVQEGEEGTMVRNLTSLYQPNKRSYDLLKLKNFDDKEFEIIGYKSGVGKFQNVPTFELKTEKGFTFEAVPTGTEETRLEYLKNADSYIGKFATVKYFGFTETKTPVPRFPIIINMNREDT